MPQIKVDIFLKKIYPSCVSITIKKVSLLICENFLCTIFVYEHFIVLLFTVKFRYTHFDVRNKKLKENRETYPHHPMFKQRFLC